MGESASVVTRGRVDMLIGALLLAGALVTLGFPVYLDSYDRWGVQLKCGNGYDSRLLQATVADQEQEKQSGPTTSYVHQCNSALLHRRAWTLPVAGLGAVILVPELVAWARRRSPSSSEPTSETSEELSDGPDVAMHDAALLDRRYRSHRPPSHDTTL
jgi:hypothetical protein